MRAVIEAAEPRVLLSGTSYALNTVYNFTGGADGSAPYTGLIADAAGNLYGTTDGFTAVAYEIPAGTSTPTTLHTFNFGGGNGMPALSPLINDGSGHLYGTTNEGGVNGDGSIYEIDLNQSPPSFTRLASFDTSAEGGKQGQEPQGTLALVGGILYGATYSDANDDGTIFSINPSAVTPTITTLASFNGTSDGFWPNTGVIVANGNLYGTAAYNSSDSNGEVFEYNLTTNALSVVYSFSSGTNGQNPGPLVADSSGNIYGCNFYDSNEGAIFKIDTGTNTLSVLASLTGDNNGATSPHGALTIDSAGNLFGQSNGGGTNGDGAIFEVDHLTHAVTTIAAFDTNTTGDNSTNGGTLLGGMALVNGNFYGTTFDGGAHNFGTVFELTAAGPPTKLVFATQPTSQVAGNSLSGNITVDVEDANGNIMQTDNSTVTLSVATPNGSAFGAGSTVTAQAINGVATFDFLILNKAGTYTLSATDTDAGTALAPATSNSFTISHASADNVAFVTQPTNGVQGIALSPAIVVNIDDAYGNLVTNSGAAVTLGIATGGPAGAGISGNVIAANNGVATFNALTLADAGIYTLSASSSGVTSVASNPFTINGPFGPAAKIVFTDSPANTTAGSTLTDGQNHTISLQVQDANGTLVTTDNSTITLALSPSATLNGTTTVHVVNGVASFSDLSVPTAGTYTLVATDGLLAGATSNSFLISAAAVSQVGLINPPTTSSTGGPTTLTAGAQDQYGNVVTGYTTPITVTANGPAGTTAQSFTLNPTNGEATFTINLTNPGSYSFNLNSGAFTETTVSPITLSYVQPTLVFTSPINSQIVAGDKIAPITLTLYNADGVITNAKPKVTLGFFSSPTGAKLYGRTTAKGKNGQVTFKNLKIRQAATGYVMEASATGFGTGLTNTFQVVPNVAKKMAFTAQPSGVTHGSPFNVGVQLFDKYKNLCTNDASTVTLSVSPKKATINGLLSTTPVDGLAEFTGLSFDAAGKYSLKAADSAKGVGKASTKKFTVT